MSICFQYFLNTYALLLGLINVHHHLDSSILTLFLNRCRFSDRIYTSNLYSGPISTSFQCLLLGTKEFHTILEMEGDQSMKTVIFGEHDENTLRQFNKCLQTGDVVGGVLCADGHYGYSQPVGGV